MSESELNYVKRERPKVGRKWEKGCVLGGTGLVFLCVRDFLLRGME